ncbi:hypothetical protein HMH01_05510 [Halovulum dunhuangense]|uniref:Uncharacterized protein n=1 Tax=Halovulum dunhuangense TaxID=1505036 RepID=A0A849L0V7_9RHOB|nr:hypothetical protein [Halovulum dunhuangense]NNU79893.1 hypothetical protein [Halovulum dunhuangense]
MVDQEIPPDIERVIEVPLHAGVQLGEAAQQGEHLPGNRGGFDKIGVEAVLPRDLSREFGGHRPVPGALGFPDATGFCGDPAEASLGTIDGSVALLPGNHSGHGPPDDFLQHRLDAGLTDRAVLKFFKHVSLSCLDRGEQIDRPLYRFGEEVGAERDRQKRGRAETANFFGPAPPEVEDPVSANEVKPPFSRWFPRSAPRTM